jgi:betaine-aldehyde dehydrogenase
MTTPAAATTATIPVRTPADDTIVAVVPDCGSTNVAAAISRIRAAQPAWEALGAKGRARWLRRYGKWHRAHLGELTALLQSETGKPRQEAAVEILLALDVLGYCASNAMRFLATQHPRPHGVLTAAKRLTLTRH